ncbi:MAG: hypothetical protein ACK4Y5_10150, partial [Acetobacteraceae bacterium]
HIAGPLNHTDHRQGKNTSQNKTASQAQKPHNLAVIGLLVPSTKHVKRGRKCRPGASKITNPLF